MRSQDFSISLSMRMFVGYCRRRIHSVQLSRSFYERHNANDVMENWTQSSHRPRSSHYIIFIYGFVFVDASYILRECVWVCVCCNNRHKIIGKIDHQSVWWSRSNNKQHPERKTTFSISICLCFVCASHFFLSLALVSLKNFTYVKWRIQIMRLVNQMATMTMGKLINCCHSTMINNQLTKRKVFFFVLFYFLAVFL